MSVRVVPLSPARRRTAEHMRMSIDTSAHAFVSVEVDYTRVDRARREAGLTALPYVAAALAEAAREFPYVNASFSTAGIELRETVELGIAVDLGERGLIVPVVRGADALTVPELAAEIASLAERARGRRLTPSELRGGTITITNLGMFGTVLSVPIINQPQVAILATDGIRPRPVAVPSGHGHDVEVRPLGNIGLSFDHRAFDGAYAAGFLRAIAGRLET